MKNNILTFLLLISLNNIYSQKVLKDYYPFSNKIKHEYQVNSSGQNNGYYKSYFDTGALYESGFYKNGIKEGIWNGYDLYGKGELMSMTNYKDGKMHGSYKQYCIEKGAKYLCGDYIYENDIEISKITYYPNGKKENQVDKNGSQHWFEDGTTDIETINGKRYWYGKYNGDYKSDEKEIQEIKFDSLGITYRFWYNYANGRPENFLDQIDVYTKENLRKTWRFESNGFMRSSFINGEEVELVQLNAENIKEGYSIFKIDPNPNVSKRVRKYEEIYDLKTGNINNFDSNGYIIYTLKKNPNALTTKIFYKSGKKSSEESADKEKSVKIEYDENGLIKSEFNKNQLFYKEYVNGFLKLEQKLKKNGDYYDKINKVFYYPNGNIMKEFGCERYGDQYPSEYYREYYSSGKLQSEIPCPEEENCINLGNKKYYYTEDGILSKIENTENINDVITDAVVLNNIIFEKNRNKFEKIFLKKITVRSIGVNNGYIYNTEFEYPKGEEVYKKINKLLSDIEKKCNKSKVDSEKTQYVKEHTDIIQKMTKLKDDKIKELDEKLKSIKKVEEISSLVKTY